AERRVGGDWASGKHHVERAAPAQQTRKEESRAGIRYEPDAAPRGTEGRRGSGDADVARDRDPEARARGDTVHGGNNRLAHLADRGDRRVVAPAQLVAEMEL